MRIDRLGLGLEGDWKSVVDGVRELRIAVGPGYRVYHAWDGPALVLLLGGGDERVLLQALRNVAEKMGGTSRLAERTGMDRESLDRILMEGSDPSLSSLIVILKAIGLELSVRPRRDAA